MIVDAIINYLNNSDLGIPAFAEIPKQGVPEEFIIIEQTGSPQENQIDRSTIVTRSYAQSMERAADLAYDLDYIMMNDLLEMDLVSGVKRNTIANFTDLTTKQYRYQSVYVITHY